ncbi:MAG: hypothetical protein HC809_12205, partial [Gammaproteobacteria bacterium]|nr:hypothetical protein [Gammaproteobacteria bacterium]
MIASACLLFISSAAVSPPGPLMSRPKLVHPSQPLAVRWLMTLFQAAGSLKLAVFVIAGLAATLAMGCWAAGATLVAEGIWSAAKNLDAVVGGADLLEQAASQLPDHAWACRLHPFGLPLADPPPFPIEDLTVLLREQPDTAPPEQGRLDSVAVRSGETEITLANLVNRAARIGAGIEPDARILTCLPWDDPAAWAALVLALLDRRSIVLVRGLD